MNTFIDAGPLPYDFLVSKRKAELAALILGAMAQQGTWVGMEDKAIELADRLIKALDKKNLGHLSNPRT